MTRQEIIGLAYNIGICEANGEDDNSITISAQIEHFANVIAAAEREACARQLDGLGNDHCAAAIRARATI
jgi:hypothetical protein